MKSQFARLFAVLAVYVAGSMVGPMDADLCGHWPIRIAAALAGVAAFFASRERW